MIDIKNIKKKFKEKEVLKGINFDVKEEEKFVILGENGAGKSTLFYILTKVYNPDEGEIKIKKGKKLLGFVEEPQFMKNMNAYENIKYITSSIYKKINKESMDKYLKITGIQQHAKKKVGKYSTGMKKRLAVSILLLIDPDIYIFDEPTEGLDPIERKNFIKLMEDLKERGKSIIISTHVLSEAKEMADRVGILHDGKIKKILSKDEFKKNDEYIIFTETQKYPEWLEYKIEEGKTIIKSNNIMQTLEKLTQYGIRIKDIEKNTSILGKTFIKISSGDGKN
ncbi:ABC transporter ATP-binding protein [Marinitoga sp. 38H-ov]|uniref:ABC transporter ATP-binding protein n=1 Tax=Marinitoga sp. 38H-ov TaxID=1755814 RepID=UPI0013E9A865|nr:ABC transporter ATP-binding protein [Marinitoga sp. 38H-ov]KAF2956183.1 hypothetical protein AS160_06815 [Marinitoga sp. 38H-ov]